MSDNLKMQKLKIITIKKFCQKLKVCYFCYINLKLISNQRLCHLCSAANTTENFSENKFRKKKSNFLLYGKTPVIQFHLRTNVYHRDFIQFSVRMELYGIVWNCMELYDTKFLMYGNCMIRSFGHPGSSNFGFRIISISPFVCNL